MQLSDILTLDTTRCYVDAHSKKRVLEVLSELFVAAEPGLSTAEVFDRLIARERLGSTALGKGVAIPHGRMKNIDRALAAFVRTIEPVDYDALDQKPVDLFFGLLVPEESTEEHLAILSQMAEMFSQESLREQLRDATDEQRVLDLIASTQAEYVA